MEREKVNDFNFVFVFFLTDVSNYCKDQKIRLLVNVYYYKNNMPVVVVSCVVVIVVVVFHVLY